MDEKDKSDQVRDYVRKAFLAKMMQLNAVRHRKKLELRGELATRGHTAGSSAWVIGQLEIEEDYIADLLLQKADLYIEAFKELGLRIGPEVLKDISHSQVELVATRKSVLIGEAELVGRRGNRQINVTAYGHLGKKASTAVREIEAKIQFYNLSHPLSPESSNSSDRVLLGDLDDPESSTESSSSHDPNSKVAIRAEPEGVEKVIWPRIWSWPVVGVVVPLLLAGWMTFMTAGHALAADMFLFLSAVLFLAKFWTWEDARRQSPKRKLALLGAATILVLSSAVLAGWWNHALNSAAKTESQGALASTVSQGALEKAKVGAGKGTLNAPHSTSRQVSELAPPPTRFAGNGAKVGLSHAKEVSSVPSASHRRAVTVEDRVKAIIAEQLQVDPAKITSSDDFEMNLGADPSDVQEVMMQLEIEFGIKIPEEDIKNLHTVGETVSYVEQKVGRK